MTYLPKRMTVLSAEIKEETTFRTENAPAAATDAFFLQYDEAEKVELVAENFEYQGDLGPNAVGFGANRKVAPSGRSGRVPLSCYFRGAGAAYSVSVGPKNNFEAAMKSAGYTVTGAYSVGTEKRTYAPASPSTTPTSLTAYLWSKQLLGESKLERVKLFGGLSNLKVECPDAKPPRFIFELAGVYNEVADATFVAPTLVSTPLPALGSSTTFSYGAFSAAEVYGWSFDQGRSLSTERVPQSGNGVHLGFVAGPRKPMLTVTVQQTKFSDWNVYDIRNLASTAALAHTVGATQYNIIELLAAQAQLMDVKQANRGLIPQWTLQFLLPPSAPALDDDHSWVIR